MDGAEVKKKPPAKPVAPKAVFETRPRWLVKAYTLWNRFQPEQTLPVEPQRMGDRIIGYAVRLQPEADPMLLPKEFLQAVHTHYRTESQLKVYMEALCQILWEAGIVGSFCSEKVMVTEWKSK